MYFAPDRAEFDRKWENVERAAMPDARFHEGRFKQPPKRTNFVDFRYFQRMERFNDLCSLTSAIDEKGFTIATIDPKPTRRSFAANAVHLQLHALAYNLGNFMRTLAMPETAEPWSLASLREKLI